MDNAKVIINKNNTKKCLTLLKEFYENQELVSIANVEFPDTIAYKSKEWLYYIFYSCLLDYGMKSKIYHQNLINTFYKYPQIFKPNYVVETFGNNTEELFNIIKNNIHPRYPNIAFKKWMSLSVELSKYKDLLSKIQSFDRFSDISLFIKNINGYGQKTGGLLLRLISESEICSFKDDICAIPMDRHDIEISYLNSIINSKKLNSKEIEKLSNSWIEVGKNLNLNPNVVDKYLWEIGNQFCSHKDCLNCPLKENCKTKLN